MWRKEGAWARATYGVNPFVRFRRRPRVNFCSNVTLAGPTGRVESERAVGVRFSFFFSIFSNVGITVGILAQTYPQSI